jgi:hypothetical protein
MVLGQILNIYANDMNLSFIYWLFFLSFLINNQLQSNGYTISGYVSDTKSNQSLIGANIFIVGTSLGSATNEKGFYKITNVDEGRYDLKVTYIGYKTSTETINIEPDSIIHSLQKFTIRFNINSLSRCFVSYISNL